MKHDIIIEFDDDVIRNSKQIQPFQVIAAESTLSEQFHWWIHSAILWLHFNIYNLNEINSIEWQIEIEVRWMRTWVFSIHCNSMWRAVWLDWVWAHGDSRCHVPNKVIRCCRNEGRAIIHNSLVSLRVFKTDRSQYPITHSTLHWSYWLGSYLPCHKAVSLLSLIFKITNASAISTSINWTDAYFLINKSASVFQEKGDPFWTQKQIYFRSWTNVS